MADLSSKHSYSYEDVLAKRLDIALDELYKGYGHEDEQIQSPKLIDKSLFQRDCPRQIKKWNITGGGSFTDNEALMEANHGLSIYFEVVKVNLLTFMKALEIVRMGNISDESLEIFW